MLDVATTFWPTASDLPRIVVAGVQLFLFAFWAGAAAHVVGASADFQVEIELQPLDDLGAEIIFHQGHYFAAFRL
jgi:hypothetical protein